MPTLTPQFQAIIDAVIKTEGGYVNDPSDRGGETNFGITAAVWRANGYVGAIADAPRSLAVQIYFQRYIVLPRFDSVFFISQKIGMEIIDSGVNLGPAVASMWLQRWLNGLNLTPANDLFVDGRLGQISLNALQQFLSKRPIDGESILLKGLNGIQAQRYLEITEADKTQRKFLAGWINARVGL